MSYITVDQVATIALPLGKGATIAKIDKVGLSPYSALPRGSQMAWHEVGQQSVC